METGNPQVRDVRAGPGKVGRTEGSLGKVGRAQVRGPSHFAETPHSGVGRRPEGALGTRPTEADEQGPHRAGSGPYGRGGDRGRPRLPGGGSRADEPVLGADEPVLLAVDEPVLGTAGTNGSGRVRAWSTGVRAGGLPPPGRGRPRDEPVLLAVDEPVLGTRPTEDEQGLGEVPADPAALGTEVDERPLPGAPGGT